jgi:hypothetical protein
MSNRYTLWCSSWDRFCEAKGVLRVHRIAGRDARLPLLTCRHGERVWRGEAAIWGDRSCMIPRWMGARAAGGRPRAGAGGHQPVARGVWHCSDRRRRRDGGVRSFRTRAPRSRALGYRDGRRGWPRADPEAARLTTGSRRPAARGLEPWPRGAGQHGGGPGARLITDRVRESGRARERSI